MKQQLGQVESKTPFEWDPLSDKVICKGNSYIIKPISKHTGYSVKTLEAELKRRAKLLEKMHKQGIAHHKAVAEVVNSYYKNPKAVLARFKIK